MGARIALVLAIGILSLALLLDFEKSSNIEKTIDLKDESLAAAVARNREISNRRASNASELMPVLAASQLDIESPIQNVDFKRFREGPNLPIKNETNSRHGWLETSAGVEQILEYAERTGRDWVYGWIQVAAGVDRAQLEAQWEGHDVQALGFSGEFARVRFPNSRDSIETLAKHPSVIGMGIQPSTEKISSKLQSLMNSTSGELPVLISLIVEDSNGTWRNELEAKGTVVGEWLPYARAYSANANVEAISTIAGFDFVTGIEPIEIFQVLLDTAVPAMGVDGVRVYDGATATFSGATGESVPVGVVDTGLNIAHRDISTNRTSICGGNFYPDDSGDGELDLWSDYGGHGTHVTGIIAGNGVANPAFAGMAPTIQHLRIAKVLNRDGSGDSVTVANGVRYLLKETSCDWQGNMSEPVKPLVLNMSLGGPGERDGRGASNRNIDAVIAGGSQLLVVAAGNNGAAGTSNEATAKNVLAVGAVTDAGMVASFSSHGPTADGRLNPHVVGTGSSIVSAKGNSSSESYVRFNGTSMAAPSVAGVAALLMDQNPEFRNAPAYAKARLMASAVKPSRTLGLAEFPLTNADGPGAFNEEFGLGLVSASVAIQDGADGIWSHGGDHATVEAGETYEYEIEIAESTARLDIVLTWIESPSEAIAPSAVVANLDLYLDQGDDCGASDCGEYASTSSIDNVEWIVVKDPEPGIYALRILATNDFAHSVHAGIAWTAIANSDTPTVTVSTEQEVMNIEEGNPFEIDLSVGTDGFLAAGTTVHVVCRSESMMGCDGYEEANWLPSSYVLRRDTTKTLIDTPINVAVPLGEVQIGELRSLSLVVPRGVATASHTLYFVATSWNAEPGMATVDIEIPGSESLVDARRPANDALNDAAILVAESGETTIDLLLATREPGEPMLQVEAAGSGIKKFFSDSRLNPSNFDEEMQSYARHASVWYSIEADRSGPYRLSIEPEQMREGTWMAIYEGSTAQNSNRIVALEGVAEFRAKSGKRYLVQVWTAESDRVPLRLTWNQFLEQPPENDDFEDRTTLAGSRGGIAGTNYRATLENFEFYGLRSVGASTWFRWVAPETRRYEFSVSADLRAFVFDGTNTETLRRVSTMPSLANDVQFEAAENREYHVVVVDSGERLVPDYWISWEPAILPSVGYAENDMVRFATTIEGEAGDVSLNPFSARTVEPNEDTRTGVGTSWWRWNPATNGDVVFRLNGAGFGKLAVFSGTSIDDLVFVTDGDLLRFATQADRQYWLSLGYRNDSMFADVDGNALARGFSWGPLPMNDGITSATLLTGVTGTVTANHSYATSSREELSHIRGHSSLWWRWVAPATGWQRFALRDWESVGFEEETQQGILAVYQNRESSPRLIATSDRTYMANGRAEAVIRAEMDEEYLVRVALRSTQLGNWNRELSFSYEPVEAPAWQRYAGRMAEFGVLENDIEDRDLFDPRSIAVVGESGLVVVAARDALVTYTEDDGGTLSQQVKVPYRDPAGTEIDVEDEALLHWDSNGNRLYLVQQNGIFEVTAPVSGESRLTRCNPESLTGVTPVQASVDTSSKNMYVLGTEGLDVYTINASCELALLQALRSEFRFESNLPMARTNELVGVRSIVLSPDEERLYAMGNEGLATFSRTTEGRLTHDTTLASREWATDVFSDFSSGSVVLGSEEILFAVSGSSPLVAAFRISNQGTGENPEFLDSIDRFFISPQSFYRYPFYSHLEWPRSSEGCAVVSAYSHFGPTVDVFCDGHVYTFRWDETEEKLRVTDWFQLEQADRFGGLLSDGAESLTPKKIVENSQGNRNYVLGTSSIGTLHIFDRASRITSNPYQ